MTSIDQINHKTLLSVATNRPVL